MTEHDTILRDLTISLSLFIVTAVATVVVMAYQYNSIDTSDWFEPKTENATLEVVEGGTGQTVNPQLTVDGSTLQGREL